MAFIARRHALNRYTTADVMRSQACDEIKLYVLTYAEQNQSFYENTFVLNSKYCEEPL